jgi:isopentenyl phosphate kinase
MFRLNHLVCSSLSEAGMNPYPFSPFDLLTLAGASARPWIAALLKAGLVPVTFGDVVSDGRGKFRILSGDTIAYELCRLLRPDRCVFALDVDGVYDEKGELIANLTTGSKRRPKLGPATDATGGIALKVAEAARIAALGVPASFVSGLKPDEFAKSLRGLRFHGSIVKGHP